MNGKEFLQRLLHWLKLSKKPSFSEASSTNGQGETILMLRKLRQTEEIELTCDEVFELLDEYIEMAMKGENVARLMPLVQQHLEMCPDCREEYEALERIVKASIS